MEQFTWMEQELIKILERFTCKEPRTHEGWNSLNVGNQEHMKVNGTVYMKGTKNTWRLIEQFTCREPRTHEGWWNSLYVGNQEHMKVDRTVDM